MIYFPQRINAPFRADIVGGFVKPTRLISAQRDYLESKITKKELEQTENDEIEKLVNYLYELGLEVSTDGGFRHDGLPADFFCGLEGVERTADGAVILCGKVGYNPSHPFLRHFNFLKSITPMGMTPRQSLPSPTWLLAQLSNPYSDTVSHSDIEGIALDIARAYRHTMSTLYEGGCRNINFEDPVSASSGVADRNLRVVRLMIDEMLSERHDDESITFHMLQGDPSNPTYGPYSDLLLAHKAIDAYYLDFDPSQPCDFEPLRKISEEKVVALGMISAYNPDPEDKDSVAALINEASRFVPLEHLCLSTMSGFNTGTMTEQQQWSKMRHLQEIADTIW